MAKVKICGLRRDEDIQIVNQYKPDYVGFIIDYPKSFRNVSIDQVKEWKSQLDPSIQVVGVFVDEDVDIVTDCLQKQIIDIAQLHGKEDEDYINRVKEYGPVIKAFQIQNEQDIQSAIESHADHVLLDQGKGSGKNFDWNLIKEMKRPYFLAGGITVENVLDTKKYHPYAIDVSSSVESNQKKDKEKVKEMIEKGRKV